MECAVFKEAYDKKGLKWDLVASQSMQGCVKEAYDKKGLEWEPQWRGRILPLSG